MTTQNDEWSLVEALATARRREQATTAIPSIERLSEIYEEHIAELGDLLRARYDAAEKLSADENYAERLRLSALLGGVEGKNEMERKASLASALLDDGHYQDLLVEMKEEKKNLASIDIAIELKRLRMRLAGWQMEWLIAQEQEK